MTPDKYIASVAARQQGLVTRSQALAVGFTRHTLEGRVRRGQMIRRQSGVYQVGPCAGPRAAEMAACLACGEDSAVSHGSAFALWELRAAGRARDVEVTVARGYRSRPGVRLHRATWWPTDHRTRLDGVPVTTVPRTLLDVAPGIEHRQLERAVADALARRLTSLRVLQALLAGAPRRTRGARQLASVLEASEPALTRSEAEERFLALVAASGLPRPETNVRLHGFEVDFLWRAPRLVVEVDGWAAHGTPAAFHRDRRRDAVLLMAGYRVLRVTWRDLVEVPGQLLETLRSVLGAGS